MFQMRSDWLLPCSGRYSGSPAGHFYRSAGDDISIIGASLPLQVHDRSGVSLSRYHQAQIRYFLVIFPAFGVTAGRAMAAALSSPMPSCRSRGWTTASTGMKDVGSW